MNYLLLLKHSYEKSYQYDVGNDGCKPSKLEWLGEEVFGFTTYEDRIIELLSKKALEVCQAISSNTTFDYIESSQGNLWYLIMVNMPFFISRIDWGTSIRGAWWDDPKTVCGCSFYEGELQVTELNFTCEQWLEFIDAIIDFAKE